MTRIASTNRDRRKGTSKDHDMAIEIFHAPDFGDRNVEVRLGYVVVRMAAPDEAAINAGVEFSTDGLLRAKTQLARPGVVIRTKKDVPLYHLDENDSNIVIRKLNGQVDRGVLQDGVFRVTL